MKKQTKSAKRQEEYLSRIDPPSRGAFVPLPGWGKPPSLLTFVLNVLAWDREVVWANLRNYLNSDFLVRSPEMDAAWKRLQAQPELLSHAIDGTITMMGDLAEMWIDSGKSQENPDADTPSDRNTEVILPGRSTSLFRVISIGLFDRFPRYTGMRRDGTQGPMTHGNPRFDLETGLVLALKNFGESWAMYWFAELLNSPYARKIARCDHCGDYFAYERTRLRTVKYGVFCPKLECQTAAAEKRMARSLANRIDTAARAWIEWEATRKGDPEPGWIAEHVNQVHSTPYGRRWVSQNKTKIMERVVSLRRRTHGTQKTR